MRNANHYFGSHNGTENFYRHSLSEVIYTDGVKQLAEACQAFWLIDLIASHQLSKHIRIQPFQVWELERLKEDSFFIICTDGNNNEITTQNIPYSDFVYDLATIWLVDGCMMLPSEY